MLSPEICIFVATRSARKIALPSQSILHAKQGNMLSFRISFTIFHEFMLISATTPTSIQEYLSTTENLSDRPCLCGLCISVRNHGFRNPKYSATLPGQILTTNSTSSFIHICTLSLSIIQSPFSNIQRGATPWSYLAETKVGWSVPFQIYFSVSKPQVTGKNWTA